MEYVGLLAPIAFVFALSALAQIGVMKKELDSLKKKINDPEDEKSDSSNSQQEKEVYRRHSHEDD